MNRETGQNGSALMWILVAVVLLAALTAAMNQGSRSSSGMASDQQARLIATEILSYSSSIRQSVQMLLMRGCSESEISFKNNNPETLDYSNPNAPENERCHVFSGKGGGITFQTLQKEAYVPSWYSNQPIFWAALSVEGSGTEKVDLVILYNSLTKNVCLAINNILGISPENGEPPSESRESIASPQLYRGSFSTSIPGDPLGDIEKFSQKKSFCYKDAGGEYQFVHVLIER